MDRQPVFTGNRADQMTAFSEATRMRFHTSFSLPKVVPADAVLVHGSVRPSGRQRGFQAWMSRRDAPGLVACDCGGFPPELGLHYRLERAKSA
jgi:hypothetical protein